MSLVPHVPYPAQELAALQLAGHRRFARRFGRLLLVLLVVLPFALAFTPWQQNMHGEGRVIEFDPIDRPMPIQARVDGLLLKWHVREGQQVKVGEPIVDLADNDPRVLERGETVPVEHPRFGRVADVIGPGLPIRFSGAPIAVPRAAPAVGQDNELVYGQWLGYDAATLARLRAAGNI